MNYLVAASTDIGLTKGTNQDSFSVQVLGTAQGSMVFAVLCDGMGGLDKGEVASATVVHAFNQWVSHTLPRLCDGEISDAVIRKEWEDLITVNNEKIKTYGAQCATKLGTTVTAMLITGTRFYIVNVGDTRAYEIAAQAVALTKDQTVVARDVESGAITPEEAETDPRRSVLLQCIGASDKVYPDFFYGDTRKDAVYMLCSDGFRHEISNEEIHAFLQPGVMTTAENMKSNIDQLINMNKQRRERDNITSITIRTF